MRIGTPRVPSVLLLATLCLAASSASGQEASPIVGDWRGTLKAGGIELTVIFHIRSASGGSLTATMDSPDQGAEGIPVDTVSFEEGHLSMKSTAVAGTYEGDLGENGIITGKWSQGGGEFSLDLEKSDEAEVPRVRPQEPTEPYPYIEEEVTIQTPDPSLRLAGTLTLPRAVERPPAAILISGSGPQNRDEALMGHKPFLVLADHLTRNGIAVLRLDDRGVGQSTGTFATATSADFADDVFAAVQFLESRGDVGEIGLIGHSEGGLIGPMVANRSPEVDFVIMMAGPGLTGEELLYLQSRVIILASGGTEEAAALNRTSQEALFMILKAEADDPAAEVKLRAVMKAAATESSAGLSDEELEPQIRAQLQQLLSPWFRFFLTYDPVPALQQLKAPVLALNGEKDTQVPVVENFTAIRKALEEGGHTDFELVEMPGLNHLFQTAETGAPAEYASIEETMSPVALETISAWILARFGSN